VIASVVLIAVYLVYYYVFSYFITRMDGDYDISKKHLGKSLPPFPNGWYIICKSNELPPGAVKSIDISG
jgi:cholesterol 7-dehydrogenase